MTMTNKVIDFLTTQLKEAKDIFNDITNKTEAGTLTSHDVVRAGAKFWIGTVERLWGFVPADGTPVIFGTVGAGAARYDSDPLSIQALPSGTVVQTALIRVRSTNAAATGNASFPKQPDGTYKFAVTGLGNLTAGDLFLVPAFHTPAAAQQTTVALLVLAVT
ncbi:MAG TPA: hypothetical protein VNO26_06950 [Candidatus Limnocylindria bacterium]|nr:hypothetical protein [Candidatus Limnocylindria bacterium]